MLTTVRLDRKSEMIVNRLVRRTGRSKSEVIRQAIAHLARVEAASGTAGSAYEAMEHAFGCWDSGGAGVSEHTGEKFRALLATAPPTGRRRRVARTEAVRAPRRRRPIRGA
jgi:Arc/MetJ-type ribon-helix-helix transcriptional regulator